MKKHPPAISIQRARELRRDPTAAEKRMWHLLKECFPEIHFRRQVPIRHYIADFASHRLKVVIEIDGGCVLRLQQHPGHFHPHPTSASEPFDQLRTRKPAYPFPIKGEGGQ